jgi:hypothetical protein
MGELAGPHTWMIVGSEIGADARPETDEADRRAWAMTVLQPTLEMALVVYDVPHTLARLADRIAGDDIQWRYIAHQGATFRFAALDIPAIQHSNGQPLVAIVSAATRKYRRGRAALAYAACRALSDVRREEAGPLWIEDRHAEESAHGPKFWLLVWWVGRGPLPTAGPAPVARIEDILAQGDNPHVWHRAK